MMFHDRLSEEDRRRFREAFITEQLARCGSYMDVNEARNAIRDFITLTEELLDTYDVDLTEEWVLDAQTGVITYK